MRRTFQDRYAHDLQAAIDAGSTSSLHIKASFVPPPGYEDERPPSPPSRPPRSPRSPKSPKVPASPGTSTTYLNPLPPPDPHSPTILLPTAPAIEFIRETLYAALADVLEQIPSIRQVLRTNPSRAYFSAVALAILEVATYSTDRDEHNPTIRGVLGKSLSLSECPVELQPFMKELCAIGRQARDMIEEDSVASVQALQHDKELPFPRLERARSILEGGVGHAYNDTMDSRGFGEQDHHSRRSEDSPSHNTNITDPRRRTTSTENRAVAFANRINALALGMTRLKAFKERQEMVFKVLIGVGG